MVGFNSCESIQEQVDAMGFNRPLQQGNLSYGYNQAAKDLLGFSWSNLASATTNPNRTTRDLPPSYQGWERDKARV